MSNSHSLTKILVLNQLTTKVVVGNSASLVPALGDKSHMFCSDSRRCLDFGMFVSRDVISTSSFARLLRSSGRCSIRLFSEMRRNHREEGGRSACTFHDHSMHPSLLVTDDRIMESKTSISRMIGNIFCTPTRLTRKVGPRDDEY